MKRLIDGVCQFQNRVFPAMRSQFEALAACQKPSTLFITCADSRIDPSLITQTAPGEIFVHRNPGNLVPRFQNASGGEAASIEYAICVLGVQDVVICGHSQCGAVAGLARPESIADLDHVAHWLEHAKESERISEPLDVLPESDDPLLGLAARNVVVQLDHLIGYPFVKERVASDNLKLHAWVYVIETGEIGVYQPTEERFVRAASLAV